MSMELNLSRTRAVAIFGKMICPITHRGQEHEMVIVISSLTQLAYWCPECGGTLVCNEAPSEFSKFLWTAGPPDHVPVRGWLLLPNPSNLIQKKVKKVKKVKKKRAKAKKAAPSGIRTEPDEDSENLRRYVGQMQPYSEMPIRKSKKQIREGRMDLDALDNGSDLLDDFAKWTFE
jgi:hypothetical protein